MSHSASSSDSITDNRYHEEPEQHSACVLRVDPESSRRGNRVGRERHAAERLAELKIFTGEEDSRFADQPHEIAKSSTFYLKLREAESSLTFGIHVGD